MEIENEIVERGVWYEVAEDLRTYHFANGGSYSVRDCNRLKVSERGTHYVLDTRDVLHIINNSWIAIEVVE